MSIFQKILLAPLLSLALYTGFLGYSQWNNQRHNEYLRDMRDNLLPAVALARDNTRLFNELSDVFKDAVTAGEYSWTRGAIATRQQIEQNLTDLLALRTTLHDSDIKRLQESIDSYYDYASQLADQVLLSGQELTSQAQAISAVELFHNTTTSQLMVVQQALEDTLDLELERSHKSATRLLWSGAATTVLLLLISASITMAIAFSVRKNLSRVVIRMRELANGDTDFSRRLEHHRDDELGKLVFWFNRLSDKLEADYKTIETVSITDKLTGLNNRTRTDQFFSDALEKTSESQQSLCVILLDIDHFKSINDKHGHLVGDEVLKAVADRLKRCAGPGDFLGRWGGEEFILILPEKSLQDATKQAETIREAICATEISPVGIVTVSLGVAGQPVPREGMDELIGRADANLYQAKSGGRNRVVST